MKSEHLAKADFLRGLRSYIRDLYDLGDFTCKNPERERLVIKLEGYTDAGIVVGVVTLREVQTEIDKAHLEKFGEAREARRARVLNELMAAKEASAMNSAEPDLDWTEYDKPSFSRRL